MKIEIDCILAPVKYVGSEKPARTLTNMFKSCVSFSESCIERIFKLI